MRDEPSRPSGPSARSGRVAVVLAALPLLLGSVAWAAARTGLVADPRTSVRLSALAGDWLLAAGALASALAVALVAVALRRDAVWRRRQRARARAAAEERRVLLSRLDHELKNPLMAVRAAVANLSAGLDGGADGGADGSPDGARAAGLRSIEEQVLRLSRLTADLRKIADVRSGALDTAPVDVPRLLEEAVEVVREQPSAAGRDLRVDVPRAPWPLPRVTGDEDLLSLAVTNLLDNAVKYTPAGGTIEVRARESGGSVVVEVADTGPGIAPEELPRIWEELYRGPRTRAVAGSGLGLPLVRAVVERHGGTVAAESRTGHGTAVRIALPVGPAVPDPPPGVPGRARRRGRGAATAS